jgi:hypothetical protein
MSQEIEEKEPKKWINNDFVRNAQGIYKRSAVEQVLGINSNSWKRLEEKGVIPKTGSYADVCAAIVKYYQSTQEIKLAAAEARAKEDEGKRNYRSADTESGLPRIQEAAIIAKIKLDKAREESIHLENLNTKGNVIDANQQFELLGTILSNISNELKAVAAEKPETQEAVDKCFRQLHRFGKIVCEQVQLDGERYVKEKMDEEVDLESIIEMGLEL